MENLIRRAATALSLGVCPKDVIKSLIKSSIDQETAYLAVKAGGVFNKMQG